MDFSHENVRKTLFNIFVSEFSATYEMFQQSKQWNSVDAKSGDYERMSHLNYLIFS